jgi:hypothetical protein
VVGKMMVEIATSVRRYKSDNGLPLGTELQKLQLIPVNDKLTAQLENSFSDLISITRAQEIELAEQIDLALTTILDTTEIKAAIEV